MNEDNMPSDPLPTSPAASDETPAVVNRLPAEVGASLRKVLNSHGYGFHYAVLARARELAQQERSYWALQSAEFPVRVGAFDTRIDFVLKRLHEPQYLVGECKRANPATANWCFVRAPFVNRGPAGAPRKLTVEALHVDESNHVSAAGVALGFSDDLYHLGFELRTGEKGDAGGAARTQIEDAATQVSKGTNGLTEFLCGHPEILEHAAKTILIPAIFTTARLWASDVDLTAADLTSGNLAPEDVGATPKPWLWLANHVSPGLRHSAPLDGTAKSVSEALELEYSRAIAIVSPEGIDQFLARDWD